MANIIAETSTVTCTDGRRYTLSRLQRPQQRSQPQQHRAKRSHAPSQQSVWSIGFSSKTQYASRRMHSRTAAVNGGSAADPDSGGPALDNETTLQQLVQLFRTDQLPHLAEDHPLHPFSIGMNFLSWLSNREHEAAGDEKRELSALAAALVAMREGLRPLSTAEYAAAEADAAEASSSNGSQLAELHTSPRYGSLSEAEIEEIARRRAALALSPAGLALANRQVEELKGGVAEARARSAVELMGRAQLPDGDAGMNAAAATDRILDFLLDVEDAAEVATLLPDAFTPPDAPDQGEGDEMLSTTPLRLLNAVNARITMVAQAAEQGGISDVEQSMQRLRSLREQVLQFVDL